MTETKTLVDKLLSFNEIVIRKSKFKYKKKGCKSRKNLCTKNFTCTKKLYTHEIAAEYLSKIHFLKNAKTACKPNNRDLNRDWMKTPERLSTLLIVNFGHNSLFFVVSCCWLWTRKCFLGPILCINAEITYCCN